MPLLYSILNIICFIINRFSGNFKLDAPRESDPVCFFYIKLSAEIVLLVLHEYSLKIGR